MWHVGAVPVRIQALFIVAGIILAIVVAERRYRAAGGSPGVIIDVAVWAIPAGLVPAALGSFLAAAHSGFGQGVRTWDEALGFPGAAALGALAAWAACRHMSGRWRFTGTGRRRPPGRVTQAGPGRKRGRRRGRQRRIAPRPPRIAGKTPFPPNRRRDRVRLTDVAGAVAPAIAFGYAVAELGTWAAQEGYGRPSSLWWAVEISPAHRLSGYENFATFQPVFLYEALWAVTTGVGIIWLCRRFGLTGDRAFALQAAAYAAGGFGLFWLGIGHLPLVLGLRAGELGDAAVLVGATVYLSRTRRKRTKSPQTPHKAAMERDSPVM